MLKSYFKVLSNADPEYSKSVEQIKNILVPLYGKQLIDQLIEKVRIGTDRICEVLYEDNIPRGLIIFKNFLNNEYRELGIINGYEQKTTLPMLPEDKSTTKFSARKVIMYKLLNRGVINAISMNAECFFGTVSSEKAGTLKLLTRLGFEIVETFKDKFKTGATEYLLAHKDLQHLKDQTNIIFSV